METFSGGIHQDLMWDLTGQNGELAKTREMAAQIPGDNAWMTGTAADGPLPIGEVIGGIALLGTSMYVVSQDPETALKVGLFTTTGSIGLSAVLVDYFGKARGKGERNWAGKADGTDNPWKKLREDPKNPNNVRWKDQNGKWRTKPKPPGWPGN